MICAVQPVQMWETKRRRIKIGKEERTKRDIVEDRERDRDARWSFVRCSARGFKSFVNRLTDFMTHVRPIKIGYSC